MGGGVSRGAKAASQAGRNTLSNSGMVFFGLFGRLIAGRLRRNATTARRSSSAIPLNTV